MCVQILLLIGYDLSCASVHSRVCLRVCVGLYFFPVTGDRDVWSDTRALADGGERKKRATLRDGDAADDLGRWTSVCLVRRLGVHACEYVCVFLFPFLHVLYSYSCGTRVLHSCTRAPYSCCICDRVHSCCIRDRVHSCCICERAPYSRCICDRVRAKERERG